MPLVRNNILLYFIFSSKQEPGAAQRNSSDKLDQANK